MICGRSSLKSEPLFKPPSIKIIGFSISDSKNIEECVKIGKMIQSETNKRIPLVLGGQGIKNIELESEKEIFSLITHNPKELLSLLN